MGIPESIYYVNGKFTAKSNAMISVHDLGLIRGYGIFDFLVTYNGGTPFLLKEHLSRLVNSAKLIGLKLPFSQKMIGNIVTQTIKKNDNTQEKTVRIVVTGGVSEDSVTPSKKPTLIVMVNNRHKYPDNFYKKGVSAITFEHNRENPQAKSLNYTVGVKASVLAHKSHALEAIYVNKKMNRVYEGTTSNVFLVKNSKILTPNGDTLKGITRELVIKLCQRYLPTKTLEVKIAELYSAEEVFLTATNKEVMPVVRIDGKKIGNGKPGRVTKEIMKKYREFTQDYRQPF